MNQHIFFFILIGLSSFISAHAQEQELDPMQSWELSAAKWREVNDIDGRFRVQSPAEFLKKIDTVKTAIGPLVYHTYYLTPQQDNAENEFYMVSYTEYPAGAIHPDSTALVHDLFEETQKAAVATTRGELMFSRDGIQNFLPYRYWRIDYLNGNASIRTKAFVAQDRFYLVQAASKRIYGMNRSTDRFIDSFVVF